jgi:hypothetical protein
MSRFKYNIESLLEILHRDNAKYEEFERNIKNGSQIDINFICNCDNKTNKKFSNIVKSGAFCKECTEKNRRKKTEETCLERYGSKCSFQAEEVKEKIKETCLERYGEDNAMKSETFKDKLKNSILETYGVENIMFLESAKEKIKETCLEKFGTEYAFQAEEVKEKIKETCLERFGKEYPNQSDIIKEKIKETCLERYGKNCPFQNEEIKEKIKKSNLISLGVEYPMQSEEVKNKSKETCLKKYGKEFITQTIQYKNKSKETCLKKYGKEYPMQNQEYMEKVQKNAKKYKEYKMQSGNIRKVQGYEPFALDILCKEFTEEQIITDREFIPNIPYIFNSKKCIYFPDIYIPKNNKIIEVKSTWTYKCKDDKIKEKAEAVKSLGYNYEIWIFDAKGNLKIV